ncbi:MAG: TetR/AcrR family transcriptional regulator [Cyanobacteria bacterium P01_H01_bin.15]
MPKIVDKAAKRREILKAAIAVFSQKGYHATKMADIAVAARMGKGTLYEYFPTKESLPKEILSLFFEDSDDHLTEIKQSGLSPIEVVIAVIRLTLTEIDEIAIVTPLCFELLGSKELDQSLGLSESFSIWLGHLSQFLAEAILLGQSNGQINADVNAKTFARMLVSAVDGMGMHYCVFQVDAAFLREQFQELETMVRQRLQTVDS